MTTPPPAPPLTPEEIAEARKIIGEMWDMAAIYATRPNPYLVTITDEKRARNAAEMLDRLLSVAERLAECEMKIEELHARLTCMCGDWMDRHSHPMHAGHSPVSMYDYDRQQLQDRLADCERQLAEADGGIKMMFEFGDDAEKAAYNCSARIREALARHASRQPKGTPV